jgi:predicted short-subunit dehydrogenase-like oxidoreductase (DUF2520 family)
MKPAFAIVGCGKVGVTLARHLAAAGYRPVAFASRRSASAHTAAEAAGGGRVCREAWEATGDADVVFITTPDGTIQTIAQTLADHKGLKRGAVVLHCSGALASTVLAPVCEGGAHTGSLHPLQSFAAPVLTHNPFKGIVMAAEGDDAALAICREVAGALEAEFLVLETENKALYHAAAVVASNYLVTLLAVATRLLEGSGIPPEAALKVLLPLVRGTLQNVTERGVTQALTGPIARGDRDTVAAHCRKIGESLPDLLPFYRLMGAHTLPLAADQGGLDQDARRALSALLKFPYTPATSPER